MSSPEGIMAIFPGHGLGSLHLGASMRDILTIVKGNKAEFPSIEIHYSNTEPVTTPTVVSLPRNGLRLRFDGAGQRLRLIEIIDFRRARLSYKGSELARLDENNRVASAPVFKRVYQIFGASFPGEYLRPKAGSALGTYVLSWPGIAFTFSLQHSAWSAEKDHVSLLGSSAASPASHMAIFEGSSWPEARDDIFTRAILANRNPHQPAKVRDSQPSEIDYAGVAGNAKVDLIRRGAATFTIVLNQTTEQDLITELGPPDALHRRDPAVSHDQLKPRRTSAANGRPHLGSAPSSYSSTGTDTYDTDFDESGDTDEDATDRVDREVFWNYFSHGMDILVGPPNGAAVPTDDNTYATLLSASPHNVVLKVILHGNVPGSYAFNRHRRLRWTLSLASMPFATDLSSETNFDQLKPALLRAFSGVWPESEMRRGKVINRTWGSSPSDSNFFLPDAGEDLIEGGGSEQWLGNTRLYTFPGLVFEVLDNGAISALTVY